MKIRKLLAFTAVIAVSGIVIGFGGCSNSNDPRPDPPSPTIIGYWLRDDGLQRRVFSVDGAFRLYSATAQNGFSSSPDMRGTFTANNGMLALVSVYPYEFTFIQPFALSNNNTLTVTTHSGSGFMVFTRE